MAATKVVAYIRIRRGSYAQWVSTNPVLKEGEGGLVTSGTQDVGKIKFGNGTLAWNDLPYTIGTDGPAAIIDDPIIDIVSPGTPGSVINEGSSSEAKFHFYIPQGYPGTTVPDITGLDEVESIDFDNDLMFVYSAADGVMRKWSPSIIKQLGPPDTNNRVVFNVSTQTNANVTMPDNGWVTASIYSSTTDIGYIQLNGYVIGRSAPQNPRGSCSAQIQVRKNDIITLISPGTTANYSTLCSFYYPAFTA